MNSGRPAVSQWTVVVQTLRPVEVPLAQPVGVSVCAAQYDRGAQRLPGRLCVFLKKKLEPRDVRPR